MVPSTAPMYCLTELLIFTVALYTMFFSKQFPSRGHASLSLQLHCLLECIAVDNFNLFVVGFNDLRYVTFTSASCFINNY